MSTGHAKQPSKVAAAHPRLAWQRTSIGHSSEIPNDITQKFEFTRLTYPLKVAG